MKRKPIVAGQFYPADKEELKRQLSSFINKDSKKYDVISCILPHAGYIYSGSVAGAVISSLKPKQNFILIGPNHTGYGEDFSIITEGSYLTPLGEVRINTELAEEILKLSSELKKDSLAQEYEHSLEVEIPFLQFVFSDFKIVPIVVTYANEINCLHIAQSIVQAIKNLKVKENTLLIASSDMTHYEPYEVAKEKDMKAIKTILNLDTKKFLEVIKKENISMCGYIPSAIVLEAAKLLEAKKATLIKYNTSAETVGDYSSVVGYAGIILH